jgi:hypothetical protein
MTNLGPLTVDRRPRYYRDWADAVVALRRWALASEEETGRAGHQALGYALAYRALLTERRYLEEIERYLEAKGVAQ